MFAEKIDTLVHGLLVSDAYCLGAHWVYDEKQLREAKINWDGLNAPLAIWHKGKVAGDFTHYGDQLLWFYQFLKDKTSFDADAYQDFWFEKMQHYTGYIDGATRVSLENIKNAKNPSGASSTDLSITARIVPLLQVSNTPQEFYENVYKFIRITHNSELALACGDFFAKLLVLVLEGNEIYASIQKLLHVSSPEIQKMVQNGLESKEADTFITIREFGPACDIKEGLSGVIHLLCKYDNLQTMLQENAKAGGDSSARGMNATMIFLAKYSLDALPKKWQALNAGI
ncbi:MAG: ADP-ribosylglycohydrolase family protein [Sulfurospirillum sp.]|nr:ADP-ribosylglycohydrolase family protein [Sulfurospirillum sp.]